MKLCRTCGLNREAIAEDERALEIELVFETAVAAGMLQRGEDPMRYVLAHFAGRYLAPASMFVVWARARYILRLQRGVKLYDSMPHKLRTAG